MKTADASSGCALSFDDVLIEPCYSNVSPLDVSTETLLTPKISLKIPLVSSPMDTVTESKMAIAMAQSGGIGIIHKNMSIEDHVHEVTLVKRFESGIIYDPIVVEKDKSVRYIKQMMNKYSVSSFPVVNNLEDNTLVGVVTNRDIRFAHRDNLLISDIMTSDVITITESEINKSHELMRKNRIERIVVCDNKGKCIGLSTWIDREKRSQYPNATQDSKKRLCVGAAISVTEEDFDRACELVKAEVDVIVIDSAHGHSHMVYKQVKRLRDRFSSLNIVGGNVATYEGALFLIDAGVDAIKIGMGPGSICTTRVVTGVGIPQFTAILNGSKAIRDSGSSVCLIGDGGIRNSGDVAKAIGAGCNSVMMGYMIAGTEESPGEKFIYDGRFYKCYRGMGSISAMKSGSSARYTQKDSIKSVVPEGIEARVPYRGQVSYITQQVTGGLKSSMGYVGVNNIEEFRNTVRFLRITSHALKESHIHDVALFSDVLHHNDMNKDFRSL